MPREAQESVVRDVWRIQNNNKSGSRVLSVFECKQVFWNNILDDKEVSKEFFLGFLDY